MKGLKKVLFLLILFRKQLLLILLLGSMLIIVSSCSKISPAPQAVASPSIPIASSTSISQIIPTYTYQIVHIYPHDPGAFTEGLVYYQGSLYEGTGLEGHSSLRRVDLNNGQVLQESNLPDQYFGEGIAIFGNNIYQLTYQSHIGFIYERSSFKFIRDFPYSTEGWGLTQNGQYLIMSDGSSNLNFLDPQTLKLLGSLAVTDEGVPVEKLNELEFVKGQVYANIWPTDKIAIINLTSGQVTGYIDLTGLLQTQFFSGRVDVLNGIAYDPQNDRLLVTGKWWPYLFQINLVKK